MTDPKVRALHERIAQLEAEIASRAEARHEPGTVGVASTEEPRARVAPTDPLHAHKPAIKLRAPKGTHR
jgi:hypothetical protein